ncbi:class I SAM-dependent methyltransferase [Alkaliphilus serpentinus]|uniref:Class I SAM-dependent methyltransferase n=2 Tax=Alkaliphilus serpentinus TaxID=1482731 RepID=A0A833HN05_9FIRM|nr:class I SAM-dependent methyltransferase [Alkaliphilus serpentinus]KAB3528897.1 class I SAM-dependent methyltransferase [Alkaliphilus serpentinus]
MMEHYYTSKSATEKVIQNIEYHVKGTKLTFLTSNAVFSKSQIDFGSRHLIEWFLESHEDISGGLLDIGCGYGPIGITLAKFFPDIQITMADINERALELSEENVKINKIKNKVEILKSDGFEKITGKFNFVLTNPPIRAGKDIVFSIYEGASKHLTPGGSLYSVIQKKQGAPSSIKKMESIFGNCTIKSKKAGYYILQAIKAEQ